MLIASLYCYSLFITYVSTPKNAVCKTGSEYHHQIYIGTYNQLRTVYRTFYGFTLFHVFAICLTTLFGILAMMLFEVLLINNKKETSQFLKSLSNAYVFLCRIVGTPLIRIYLLPHMMAIADSFIDVQL